MRIGFTGGQQKIIFGQWKREMIGEVQRQQKCFSGRLNILTEKVARLR